MKNGFLLVIILMGNWLLANWFKIAIIILLIMICFRLTTIETTLYGGNGETRISNEIPQGINLLLNDTNKINSDLDSIKSSLQPKPFY